MYDEGRKRLHHVVQKARRQLMAIKRRTNDPYRPPYITDLSTETQRRIMETCGAHVMLFVRQSVILASIEGANEHLQNSRLEEEQTTKSKQKSSKLERD